MLAGVAKAIAEIRAAFGDHNVVVSEWRCGGAFVLIKEVPLGAPYEQKATWVGFFINSACPEADTYPFYVDAAISRIDKAALKTPLHTGRFWPELPNETVPGLPRRDAVMISRRQRDNESWKVESPLKKLRHVLKWMIQQ